MPRYGLLGRKLGHSFSVPIHEALFCQGYELVELEPEELAAFVARKDFEGLNVTIPYKQAVIPLCDEVSSKALEIGAVNTLVNRNGKILGYNTDILGFETMVREAGIGFQGRKVLVLGSGGTSKTVRAAARGMGASRTVVISRSGEDTYETIGRHADAQIVVNTTPVGMYPNCPEKRVDLSLFPALEGVVDVVYNPARTAIMLQARELGVPCVSGLRMLVGQAVAAEEIWLDRPIARERALEVFHDLSARMRNIVLIGMPGSGKSTIGRLLAQISGKKFVDLDEEIARMAGKPIPEIFATEGQDAFRSYETEAAKLFGKESGLVIACGGGVVTRDRNLPYLRQNGRIYEITRDVSKLPVEGRPLSQNLDNLLRMQAERALMYAHFRDAAVDNEAQPQDCAKTIWEDFRAHSHH